MSFCLRLGPASPRDEIGGKARSLLRLSESGLRVPPAIVVTSELFAALRAAGPPLPPTLAEPGALAALGQAARAVAEAAWPAGFRASLTDELDALVDRAGMRFSVRSSAAMEDDADTLGAGLFLSRLDVGAADVDGALRAVLASALAPGVLAYLSRRRASIDSLGFAVLIHPFTVGDAGGVAALDSSHGAPAIETHHGDATGARAQLQAALVRLTALHGPVEIEWMATGAEVTYLQMRPYRRPARAKTVPRELLGWRWDAAHNPLPLSPAQAGLVALVDGACDTGLRQKIVDGYLFYAHAPGAPGAKRPAAASAARALAELSALADARLTRQSFESLEEALAAFVALYEPLFGVVQPAVRQARAALADFLRRQGIDATAPLPALLAGVPSAARARTELARAFSRATDPAAQAAARAVYLDRFGDESPCWDVAVPTWFETPIRLDRRLRALGRADDEPGSDGWRTAAESIRATLPEDDRADWDRLLAAARSAAAAAEDDDALYARAQAHVRRALLLEGVRLAARGVLRRADDVFWVPLDLLRRQVRGESALTREETARLADEAHRADAAARAAPPSLAGAGPTDEASGIVRGQPGAGGVCIGRVRIWNHEEPPHDMKPRGDAEPEVIVARTLLPTELPLIYAAALVVETGGPLGHVAAQARERGIPAVVGAAGASTAFEDDDRVVVDGDAAVVARID
jgi:pyruvate,water dikinase